VVQAHPNSFQSLWQGSLWDLARILTTIRQSRAFGRLTLRNSDRVGIAHLYFHSGKLVHIVGSSGDASATLQDLQGWTHAAIRFERGSSVTGATIAEEQEQAFEALVDHFQQLGLIEKPAPSRVVEGSVAGKTPGELLLTPQEWRILIEATRRISTAVTHLFGPRESLKALRDIINACSTAFPASPALQIAPSGQLQVTVTSELDRIPRQELLEGFRVLITTCQDFCAPLAGEADAHKLVIQALGDLSPVLISLGVFQVDNELLASRKLY
jgi:hypothetical protein